jgi:cysteine desulfurase
MNEIYLDNAATTRVSPDIANTVYETMTEHFGNPSSLHKKGVEAEKILSKTRQLVANILSCDHECIYFTSGGTEGNNLAISGVVNIRNKSLRKIISTNVEHSSIMANMKKLEQFGMEIIRVSPDKNGHIDPSSIEELVDENTALVSVMHVNNETGDIYDIPAISRAVKLKNPKVIFHSDCVQAFGKININIDQLGADIVTISGHKIHAPKGVGAIYIKKGVTVHPMIIGGLQESGIRCGTENVPAIAGLGKACEFVDITNNKNHVKSLHDYLTSQLNKIPQVHMNSHVGSSEYIMNFSIEGNKSEIMLHRLEEKGIYVSNGSACSKGGRSHVLVGMGLKDSYIDSALRVSFCEHNTLEEVKFFVDTLKEIIA